MSKKNEKLQVILNNLIALTKEIQNIMNEENEEKIKNYIVSPDALAAITILLEAGTESEEGKIAIGEVIRNRIKKGRFGKSVAHVVFAPFQFSCWNTNDKNKDDAMNMTDDDPRYVSCLSAWVKSEITNLTKGATLYYNPAIVAKPAWAKPGMFLAKIGNHLFYKE